MAKFTCYVCSKPVITGQKFTFTKNGAVHYYCFISEKSKTVAEQNAEKLSVLSQLLESELQHLINILNIKDMPGELKELIDKKYKDIEKAVVETTNAINSL
ncbi:MAG: DUF2175 family protein [Thermoplasmatales archaeon]